MHPTLERARRSARAFSTGLKVYTGYRLTQRKARRLDADRASSLWEEQHQKAAADLYKLAVDLKGLYVKVGQFVGTRSDLAPAAYTSSFSRLQDRVPPRSTSVIEWVIEREFGRPVRDLFAWFDPKPLAAASLAQVHRARLADGREVAVKVQYPEIENLVRLDLHNLRLVVALLARLEPSFDYRAIVRELSEQVPLELDFEREARLSQRVARNLMREFPDLIVPQVIDGLVARRVLATEYVEGRRLVDAAAEHPDLVKLIETLTGAFAHQIMLDGLFQADPHPGNILLTPDGRPVLLDYGLTKELPEAMRLGFARLVLAAAERDPAKVVAAFRDLGVRTRSDDPASLLGMMQLFLGVRSGDRKEVREQRNSTLKMNPVEAVPHDLILLGRVVGLLRGVCASLGVQLSPMQMLRPYAERALAETGSLAERG